MCSRGHKHSTLKVMQTADYDDRNHENNNSVNLQWASCETQGAMHKGKYTEYMQHSMARRALLDEALEGVGFSLSLSNLVL